MTEYVTRRHLVQICGSELNPRRRLKVDKLHPIRIIANRQRPGAYAAAGRRSQFVVTLQLTHRSLRL